MLPRCTGFLRLQLLVLIGAAAALALNAQAAGATAKSTPTLVLDGLGKGVAPLDGPWQFHLGDDPAWASPTFDDSAWIHLTAERQWGLQGQDLLSGFAWYRLHIAVTPAPGASPNVALLIPGIQSIYQLYWNGVEVGHLGQMPPDAVEIVGGPAQTYGLGPARSGFSPSVSGYTLPAPTPPARAAGLSPSRRSAAPRPSPPPKTPSTTSGSAASSLLMAWPRSTPWSLCSA